jgi:hypothetical protein
MAIRDITQEKKFPWDDHKLHKWDVVFLVSDSRYIAQAADILTKTR